MCLQVMLHTWIEKKMGSTNQDLLESGDGGELGSLILRRELAAKSTVPISDNSKQ
jgi:hypothetical protein